LPVKAQEEGGPLVIVDLDIDDNRSGRDSKRLSRRDSNRGSRRDSRRNSYRREDSRREDHVVIEEIQGN
jgi:hypothetical protein